MVSQVFLAAMIPATRATGKASPFGRSASMIISTTSPRVWTIAWAREVLEVVPFVVTSTICAEPSARTWLSCCSIGPFHPHIRGSRLTIIRNTAYSSQHSTQSLHSSRWQGALIVRLDRSIWPHRHRSSHVLNRQMQSALPILYASRRSGLDEKRRHDCRTRGDSSRGYRRP